MKINGHDDIDKRAERMYDRIVETFGHSEHWQIRSSPTEDPKVTLMAVRVDTGQMYTEKQVLQGRWGL